MDSVNKTLYIPLYGKALVSKKGIILVDKKAEEIWDKAQFPLKGKAKSKWLAYYMGMRSATFDGWVKERLSVMPNALVLHLGCGLDSRVERIAAKTAWVDVDFEDVIAQRKRHYQETENYRMISADIRDTAFVDGLPNAESVIVVLEGVSMYLKNEDLQRLFASLTKKFARLSVLVDCYTPFAAKMSKIKNPVNEVGVSEVFGISAPSVLEKDTGLVFVKEWDITPSASIDELSGFERFVFKHLYAGRTSKKLYKLYEYATSFNG